MQRTTVDLPDPDGPISAVALLASKDSVRPLIVCRSPYHASRPSMWTVRAGAAAGAASTPRLMVMGSRGGISGGRMSGWVTAAFGGSCRAPALREASDDVQDEDEGDERQRRAPRP